jgi:hypothetical protein
MSLKRSLPCKRSYQSARVTNVQSSKCRYPFDCYLKLQVRNNRKSTSTEKIRCWKFLYNNYLDHFSGLFNGNSRVTYCSQKFAELGYGEFAFLCKIYPIEQAQNSSTVAFHRLNFAQVRYIR